MAHVTPRMAHCMLDRIYSVAELPILRLEDFFSSESPILCPAVRIFAIMIPPYAGLTDILRVLVLCEMVLDLFLRWPFAKHKI